MVKRLFFAACVTCAQLLSCGQELNVPLAKFVDKLWRASWIANPDRSENENTVVLFTKNFELSTVPAQFTITIDADNKYTLFVNGQKVCFGPQLSDIRGWRYELIDIAKHLRKGKNVLAAAVLNFGPKLFWHRILPDSPDCQPPRYSVGHRRKGQYIARRFT